MAGYASKEEARKVLEKMAEAVRADEAIRGGCGGQSLSAAFELTDYNLTLFIKFENGRVEASVGAPPEEPKVRLSLESPVLDALFSGAIDGIRAAMDGNLAFSGDIGVAIAIHGLMDDIYRLYALAKASA